jgi:iron(II)-dependent oxidoreductase
MARIFISYSRQDERFARQLAGSLSQMGADIWIDVEDIPAGMKWSSAIQQGLDAAELMIVILSPDSMASRNVEDEWQYALDQHKPIVPVLLRPAKIHFQLNRIQYIDFTDQPYEAALRQLYVEMTRKGLTLNPNMPAPELAYRPAPHQMTPPMTNPPAGGRRWPIPAIGGGLLVVVAAAIALLVALNSGNTSLPLPTPSVTPPILQATAPESLPTATPPPPTDAPTATESPTQAPTSTPIPLGLPGNPVVQNGQWQPVVMNFNGGRMLLVPVGCFSMGSNLEQVESAFQICNSALGQCNRGNYEDENPTAQVCFDQPFWIDETEVSNGQYGSAGAFPGDAYPRSNVTWNDAQAFCQARGMRLPTEAEWEYAARGPSGWVYPWGDVFDGTRLNYCDGNCTYNWRDTAFNDGYATTAPVGSYPAGASWVGALDMVGSLWEWTSSIYAFGYPYRDNDGRENPADFGSKRTLRGGSWNWIAAETRTMARDDYAENSETRYESSDWYGFRCVQDFLPGDLPG